MIVIEKQISEIKQPYFFYKGKFKEINQKYFIDKINAGCKADNNTYIPISPDIDKKRWNHFNSRSWWFSVDTGTLVMFPSSTTHQVDVKEGNNTRISLAFNTFIKGTLGDNFSLTELKL